MLLSARIALPKNLAACVAWVARMAIAATAHSQLHAPEPVGMFAGSLLARSSWDHS